MKNEKIVITIYYYDKVDKKKHMERFLKVYEDFDDLQIIFFDFNKLDS